MQSAVIVNSGNVQTAVMVEIRGGQSFGARRDGIFALELAFTQIAIHGIGCDEINCGMQTV